MKLIKLALLLSALPLALRAQAPVPTATAPPRLMVLFLDLNSMDSADQIKARDAAIEFVQNKSPSSDVIAVMANTPQGLNVLTDFTHDRDLVIATLRAVHDGMGPVTATSDAVAGLRAMQTAALMLSNLPEKKVMVYISGGVSKTGIEDQAQLATTVNTLMKANIVMYPLDARGLSSAGPQ